MQTISDYLYIALAAIRQPAMAGCWEVAHGKLAGVDDLYFFIALAGAGQPAVAGCWGVWEASWR